MICVGVNSRSPPSRRRRYVVSAGCSESQREIVEGATRWPYRDEIFCAVDSSELPRLYNVRASKISGSGYVLLRIVRGPTVKLRPQARQRKIGTSSSFFFRVPFLIKRLLLQCGQRSGVLICESRCVAGAECPTERGSVLVLRVRERICGTGYHVRRRISK